MNYNYFDWMEGRVSCSCGWSGTGADACIGETFSEGAEYDCPECGGKLRFVLFPTHLEMRDDPRADPADRAGALLALSRFEQHDREKLVSPDQLPSLAPPPTVLVWDVVDGRKECSEDVVILHGQQVLWRELSFYENYVRFGEVASILRQKYGPELIDLVPTRRSWLDLYGDALSATSHVEAARVRLRSAT